MSFFRETIFDADNHQAASFWCEAVRKKSLTLYVGVRGPDGRGLVRRLDAQNCANIIHPKEHIVYAARYGIPGLTGTWGRMEGPVSQKQVGNAEVNSGRFVDWLICYEVYLPQAWLSVLVSYADRNADQKPLVLLSSDRAFSFLPIAVLRHKVARALARLGGLVLLHAETDRTILIHTDLLQPNNSGGDDAL